MKRTLYLSMVCLLSAFSAVGQIGLRGLNPIEKQKLQLPELPASQSRVTLLRSSENVDYTQGVFILNEDWFGHNNSTINFMTSSGDFAYRIFQTANPGKELGCTSQFGTIFGDNMFITSKQPKDGGASIEGGRLNVVDAKTMKVKAQFTDIGGGDGRAFLGVNDSVGYIGASNGIFLFDIKNLTVGDQLKGASNSGGLYNGQVGMMVRTKTYVFAVQQSKGVLVIDPLKHEIIKLIEGSFSTLTQSKDGSVWVGAGSRLLCIDPETLEETYLSLPDGLTIPDSWYAWTAGVLCASTQENAIYWTKGGGFSSGNEIYRYEIGNPSSMDKPFYTIPEKGRVLYVGAGLRVSPDDKLYISAFENFGSINYWQYVVDAKTGRQLGCYPLEPSYWFPAMHIFPDNEAPVVKDFTSIEAGINDAPITVSLKDMATDKDNIAEAIYKSVKSVSNESLLSASILGDNLTLTLKPDQTGEATVSVNFDSNGKIVTKDLKVTVKGKAVYLDKHELSLNVGEKSTLKVTVPEGVSAVWTSSNSNVASVVNGEITAVAQGSAKIIVSAGNEKDTCLVNVSLSVQSLTLDVESDTTRVQRDGTLQLKVKLHPEGAVLPELLWNSSNTKVAHVNNKGLVTAFADGLAVIKVMSADSSKMDSCVIKVLANIQSVSLPESISLNTNSNGKQHTYTLKPTFIPAKPTNTVVSWKSSNEDIVTVSEKGLITAIKAGEATITVTTEDGSKTAECKVNCVQWPDAVKLDLTFVSMKPGNTQQLTITTTPDSIGAVPMKYVSDTPDVVTVDKNGVLTAKKYGEATITVTTEDGSKTAECKVNCVQWPDAVKLDLTFVSMKPGNTQQLTITTTPDSIGAVPMKYVSDTPDVVTVDKNGVLTAKKYGEAIITVSPLSGADVKATCKVAVEIPVTSIQLDKDTICQKPNTFAQLTATINPGDATFQELTWKSTSMSPVRVSSDGKVSFVRPGKSNVVVTSKYGGITDTCVIIVDSIHVESFELKQHEMTIDISKSGRLEWIYAPDDASQTMPDITAADEDILYIYYDGRIRGEKAGSTWVYANMENGKFVDSCLVHVVCDIDTVTLNKNQATIELGRTITLTPTVKVKPTVENPEEVDQTVYWESDNKEIATVVDGVVTAISGGSTRIWVYTNYGDIPAYCDVTVVPVTEAPSSSVTGVSLNASSLSLDKGETAVLAAIVTPSNAENKSVSWSSSDITVASVADDGTVTAGIAGVATITVTTDDGGYTATCEVTVTDPDLDKPVVEAADSTATLTFPKVPEATFYEVSVYKYVNEVPVLFGVYTMDADGNILTGLRSDLRLGTPGKIAISLRDLDEDSDYIVKITAVKEKDGKKEVVGTFYSEPFSTSSGTVSNETIGAGEARIYYYAGYLHLNNLESYRCYIVGFNGTVLDAFEVTDLNESRLMSFSKGSYIITAINGNDRITRKFVIK